MCQLGHSEFIIIFTLTSEKMNGKKLNPQMKRTAYKLTERATAAALVIKIKMKHNRNQVFGTFFVCCVDDYNEIG